MRVKTSITVRENQYNSVCTRYRADTNRPPTITPCFNIEGSYKHTRIISENKGSLLREICGVANCFTVLNGVSSMSTCHLYCSIYFSEIFGELTASFDIKLSKDNRDRNYKT